MKKIMIFMFCVNVAFFLFSGVQIFSVAFEQQTLAGKASVLIQKDQHTTTTEHLRKIESFFDREGADIFFRTPDLAGIYPTWIYYATDNTSRIFPGFLEGGRYDSSYIYSSSNSADSYTRKIFAINISQDYEIRPFAEASQYDLQSATFYIDADRSEEMIEKMHREGFSVSFCNYAGSISDNHTAPQLVLLGFFAMSIFFLFFREEQRDCDTEDERAFSVDLFS